MILPLTHDRSVADDELSMLVTWRRWTVPA
jgi:hypothetical protein